MDSNTRSQLDKLVQLELAGIVELRHDLHAHPQVGYEETYASGRVQEALQAAGVPFQVVATTGVVGWILPRDESKAGEKAIGMRADMDALPIQEETGLPYASSFPGFMHACGHDGNTAMLVGAATILARMRDRLPRPVKLFFQPAEEGGAGAKRMIDAGAMGREVGGVEVGAMFAQHAKAEVQAGRFGVCVGPSGARSDEIHFNIVGRGSHAARPESARDPIVAAAAVVMNLQTVVSRSIRGMDQAVVTIGQIHGGTKDNIIPPSVRMSGTVRTYDDQVAATVHRRIEEITRQTAAAMGCEGNVEIREGYPVTCNDTAAARYAIQTAREVVGADRVVEVPPTMGAEDFSYFQQRVPGCMINIGMHPPGQDYPGVHTPQFDFNDDVAANGVKLFCLLALNTEQLPKH